MAEWIDAKERMPIGEDRLLVLEAEDFTTARMTVGYWNRLTSSWMVNGERLYGLPVTHWQPLPDLPKASK